MAGREIVWTEDHPVWPEIWEDIGNNAGTIREVLAKPGRPKPMAFYEALKRYPSLEKQYASARESKARLLVDSLENIAHDESRDTYVDERGITRINNAAVQRDRLKVGAIQWRAEKELSGEYGNKVDINVDVNVQLKDRMKQAKGRVIEHNPAKVIEHDPGQAVPSNIIKDEIVIESDS